MLTFILLGSAVLIAGVLFIASRKPDCVHYERSILIRATPERIVSHIDDFRKWAAWSPWEKKDPTMERTYSGSERGTGAQYHWVGNKQVGEGRMAITRTAHDQVELDLHFIKPWETHCVTVFKATAEADGTRLTWIMDGPQIFMGKVMSLFMDMDKMIGKDFEDGLAALKAQAENA
jgi:hypothetical protein